jgi:hypothetical protein
MSDACRVCKEKCRVSTYTGIHCHPRLLLCFVGLLMTVLLEHLVFLAFPVSNLVSGSISSVPRSGHGDHILSL